MQDIDFSKIKHISKVRSGDQATVSGVRFPPKSKWPFSKLENIRFENVDFNSPILGGLLARPVFITCEFLDVDMDGLNFSKTLFENSAFRSVVFGGKYHGNVAKTKFHGCTFDACEFFSVSFSGCTFTSCELTGARLKSVNFRQCNLEDTVVDGVLESVNFIDCTMRGFDLSRTKMLDSSVIGAVEQRIAFPDRPDNFFINMDIIEEAKPILREELSTAGFDEFCAVADFVSKNPFGEIVDEGLFEDLSNGDRQTAMRTLFEVVQLARE